MSKIIQKVKGTRDFYPQEMAQRQWLIEKLRVASEAFGYQQYDGPCLEQIDLYAAKSGEELVKEQAFVFEDRGGDPITLRPELTPTVSRMVASMQNQLTFPLRWWSFGPFWRYERPQKGRTREFFQWNIDQIGSDSVLADAELLAVAARFFREVGLTPEHVQLHVNDRELMNTELSKIGVTDAQKPEILRLIDRLDKLPADVWDKLVLDAGLNETQLADLKTLFENKELWRNSERLVQVFQYLDDLGESAYISYDPRIIRGLDYYTGVVFEAHETEGEFRAILGGGHYADLVADVGGKPAPGVGFAMGDVVIMLVLEKYGLLPTDTIDPKTLFMTIFDEDCLPATLALLAELRQSGFKVVMSEIDRLGKQFRYADRIGVKRVLVLGPSEIEKELVVVKDLVTGDQQEVQRKDLISVLS
jgi:histidyl-tRNA synthetase